jgi:hypothetical protein
MRPNRPEYPIRHDAPAPRRRLHSSIAGAVLASAQQTELIGINDTDRQCATLRCKLCVACILRCMQQAAGRGVASRADPSSLDGAQKS